MSTTVALTPETIRREIACDPTRRELLRSATRELLTATSAFLGEYVSLPPEVENVLPLWVLHTWSMEACDATPYLIVRSHEPGCGKTRLLETLGYVVRSPWHTSSLTGPTLFRKIEEDHPTLLLDETDAIWSRPREELRAALDAGNRRGGTITRCEGKGCREYDVFGPKVLAGLDAGLPATILDRSIVIEMSKRTRPVERLRRHTAGEESAPLAYTLQGWGMVASGELARMRPQLPPTLSDRAADAWEPLLSIAAFAGEQWEEKALRAAQPRTPLPMPAESLLLPAMQSVMGADAPQSPTTKESHHVHGPTQ